MKGPPATAPSPAVSRPGPDSPAAVLGFCAAVLVALFVAYHPALHGDFLWDDPGHVTRPDLRSWGGLVRIWTEIGATQQYYPVLHSAFWLEHRLWGDAVLGYHLVNVLQHALAATLFFAVLRRLALPGAWFAAAAFALHPVCVESVAWISEQKNTLSAVFYLAAALAYLRFEATRSRGRYAVATALFVLGLLTKTVTATLPAALLVVAWWRHGRLDWRRDCLPLLPWLALGAAGGLFTAHFERELIGAQGADFTLGFVERLLLAGRVVWFYAGNLLWPANLVFVYPRWTIDAGSVLHWLPLGAALALLGALGWLARRREQRGPLATALLFGGTLFPVLGFFNVFPFLYSYVADHFQYLASLAAFALGGAGLTLLLARRPAAVRLGVPAVLLATLGTLTWLQAGTYRDVATLYRTTIARNPGAWMAHHNLAMVLADSGRVAEAIPHAEETVRLKPDFAPGHNNLGNDLLRAGRAPEAVPHLERAIALQPGYAVAHRNLGLALAAVGRTADALPHFAEAVRLDPAYADAELDWAIALTLTNRFPEAVPHYERALQLRPDIARYHNTYGRALARAGRLTDAIARCGEAVRLEPGLADAHYNLARAYRQLGRLDDATRHYREALRLDPSLANR